MRAEWRQNGDKKTAIIRFLTGTYKFLNAMTLLPISSISPSDSLWSRTVDIHWGIAAQMFDKRVNRAKVKIAASPRTRKTFEPWVDALAAEWHLCVQCFAIAAPTPPYENALHWFEEILKEAKLQDLKEPTGKGKVEQYLEEGQPVAEALKEGRNPYPPNNPMLLHNYLLIETALNLAAQSEGFKNRYWLPYVKAHCAWIRHKRNSPALAAALEVRGDRLITSRGKGRGKASVKYIER
ncbi:hypothetical protein [Argonema antarcticum]|uniref:hypothetical protein n=1 Tax=Argonema antarcticum TaxID=2942763 RepID=UPI00201215AF|nr:hypothetical protein [Argonema antarcticum]MCL1475702.1 hypothetical protein [Argonema antarcticum A004/B2]